MKLYVSTTGSKRVAIQSAAARGGGDWQEMKGKNSSAAAFGRRLYFRTAILPAVLLFGVVLPLLFVRTAFLVLDSAAVCSSSIGCVTLRIFGGSDPALVWNINGGAKEMFFSMMIDSSRENFDLINRCHTLRKISSVLTRMGMYIRKYFLPTIGCCILKWTFEMIREELTMALLEATISNDDDNRDAVTIGTVEGSNAEPVSFKDLVKDMVVNKQDIKAFAYKTRAILTKMERMVKAAKWQESVYWHLAANGVPKNLHCLSLKLAEEYAVNAVARSSLPLPQHVYHLTDNLLHHIVLLTDNILAASVVISSTIKASIDPSKLVFHVVTDKRTYTSMHAWFALDKKDSAVVEVKGLHQYDWPHEVNVRMKEVLDIHHQIFNYKYKNLKKEDFDGKEDDHELGVLSPSVTSLLNHLRIYLTELFPDLEKVLFLDDDIVVQRDLSSLWQLDLNEKVVGAVVDSWCGHGCCPGRKYKDYFNFANPLISSNFDQDHCGWLYGMSIFDLKTWRKTNITAVYHQWLKLNLNSGFTLWRPGALPPSLIAFEGHVQPIDPSWQIAGLGQWHLQVEKRKLETAATIHFSGPAKPWLEIASPQVKSLWNQHINSSNEHLKGCGITASEGINVYL